MRTNRLMHLIDPTTIVTTLGYAGVLTIIFVESSLFFGFFLPGDSLLFTAGLLAVSGYVGIVPLMLMVPIAAALGVAVGYWFGVWIGPHLFTKENSFFFNKKHITRSHEFFEKYGPRAIVLSRFIPVVRTFVPIVAGVGRMNFVTFWFYNIIGAILWGDGVLLLGYFLGRTFPIIQEYLSVAIAIVVLISFIPLALEWRRHRKNPHN